MLVIATLGKLKQEELCKLEGSLGYMVSSRIYGEFHVQYDI